jgi:hypothetical protein
VSEHAIRLIGVVVFVLSAALLTSLGGLGIVASPLTLPLMYVIVRSHPTIAFRIAGVLIGGLTALEGGWGLGYLLFGYDTPATFVTAGVVGTTAIWLFARAGRERRHAMAIGRGSA